MERTIERLTILFIGLKLAGFIDWSWWWVFSPVWIELCIVVLVVIVNNVIEYWKWKS